MRNMTSSQTSYWYCIPVQCNVPYARYTPVLSVPNLGNSAAIRDRFYESGTIDEKVRHRKGTPRISSSTAQSFLSLVVARCLTNNSMNMAMSWR